MRSCVCCRKELEPTNFSYYCSDECKTKIISEKHKNPLSFYGSGSSDYDRDVHYRQGAVRSMGIEPEILEKAEQNECATYEEHPGRIIVEDTEAVFNIIFEEMNAPEYKKITNKANNRKNRKLRQLRKKNNESSPRDQKGSSLKYPNYNYKLKLN